MRVIGCGISPNGAATARTAQQRAAAIHSVSEMRAASSAQERAGEVVPSPGDDPALSTSSTTRDAALEFWRRVARGIVRLSPNTDALITSLRAQGLNWVEVTERIRAAHVREQRGAIQARFRERQRGKRWREEYRNSKGEQR